MSKSNTKKDYLKKKIQPISKKFSMIMKQDLHIPTKFPHPLKINLFNQVYTTNVHNFNAHKIQV